MYRDVAAGTVYVCCGRRRCAGIHAMYLLLVRPSSTYLCSCSTNTLVYGTVVKPVTSRLEAPETIELELTARAVEAVFDDGMRHEQSKSRDVATNQNRRRPDGWSGTRTYQKLTQLTLD